MYNFKIHSIFSQETKEGELELVRLGKGNRYGTQKLEHLTQE